MHAGGQMRTHFTTRCQLCSACAAPLQTDVQQSPCTESLLSKRSEAKWQSNYRSKVITDIKLFSVSSCFAVKCNLGASANVSCVFPTACLWLTPLVRKEVESTHAHGCTHKKTTGDVTFHWRCYDATSQNVISLMSKKPCPPSKTFSLGHFLFFCKIKTNFNK